MFVRKTPVDIAAVRTAGQVVALVLGEMERAIVPGVTRTADLDRLAARIAQSRGAIPVFLGYRGYPASTCVSVNDAVVHGIPGGRILQSGDIVSLDFACRVGGFCADAATTIAVGEVSPQARRLLAVTREALFQGIDQVRPGGRIGDIGVAIQRHVERAGFFVVRRLVGHGIGRALHEAPQVPNIGRPGWGARLVEGMTLALEPIVGAGTHRVRALGDGWTIVTADGGLSAHFEHTVAVTRQGVEILTLSAPCVSPPWASDEASVAVGV